MADLIYLYAAYTIVWAALLLFGLRLALELRRLEKELKTLKEAVDERGK